jgi:hypothetical protein
VGCGRGGSVSVGPGVQPQLRVAWGCGMRERGDLGAWGAWNPRWAGGGGLAAKPKTEPPGLGIGGTWGSTPANGSVGLWDAGEGAIWGPGGPGARDGRGGAVWRAKPKIEPPGLDIGGTWGKPPANGSRGLWDAGEGPVGGLGGLEPEMHRGGPVWRAKPKIEPPGLDIGGTWVNPS